MVLGNKVEWFRAKIDLQQWREELEILDEEFKRTARWFTKMSELWTVLALRSPLVSRGFAEYAHHKADIFKRRSEDASEEHIWALTVDLVTGKCP